MKNVFSFISLIALVVLFVCIVGCKDALIEDDSPVAPSNGDSASIPVIPSTTEESLNIGDSNSEYVSKLGRNAVSYNGWVYYVSSLTPGICRMRDDGSEKERITDDFPVADLVVYGEWLYYVCTIVTTIP